MKKLLLFLAVIHFCLGASAQTKQKDESIATSRIVELRDDEKRNLSATRASTNNPIIGELYLLQAKNINIYGKNFSVGANIYNNTDKTIRYMVRCVLSKNSREVYTNDLCYAYHTEYGITTDEPAYIIPNSSSVFSWSNLNLCNFKSLQDWLSAGDNELYVEFYDYDAYQKNKQKVYLGRTEPVNVNIVVLPEDHDLWTDLDGKVKIDEKFDVTVDIDNRSDTRFSGKFELRFYDYEKEDYGELIAKTTNSVTLEPKMSTPVRFKSDVTFKKGGYWGVVLVAVYDNTRYIISEDTELHVPPIFNLQIKPFKEDPVAKNNILIKYGQPFDVKYSINIKDCDFDDYATYTKGQGYRFYPEIQLFDSENKNANLCAFELANDSYDGGTINRNHTFKWSFYNGQRRDYYDLRLELMEYDVKDNEIYYCLYEPEEGFEPGCGTISMPGQVRVTIDKDVVIQDLYLEQKFINNQQLHIVLHNPGELRAHGHLDFHSIDRPMDVALRKSFWLEPNETKEYQTTVYEMFFRDKEVLSFNVEMKYSQSLSVLDEGIDLGTYNLSIPNKITSPTSDEKRSQYYDINGRPTKDDKGLIIHDGRKTIVK